MITLKSFLKKYPYSVIFLISVFHLISTLYIFRDTELTNYPYLHQDFWKRMQDALYYTNGQTEPAFHPPVPSLLYSLVLVILDSSKLFLVHIGMYIFTLNSIYFLSKKLTKNTLAAIFASILFAFNFYTLQQANYLGLTDLFASSFVAFAVLFFLEYLEKGKKKNYVLSAVFIGFGALVQYAGAFTGPILLVYAYKTRGKEFMMKRKMDFINLSLIASTIFLSFFALKAIFYGNPLYTRVEHLWFFRPHAEDIGYYLFNFFVFYSPIVALVAIYMLYRKYKQKDTEFLNKLMIFLPFIIFFMLLYIWEDMRFFTYISPAVYTLAGLGFYKIYKYFEVKNRIGIFFLLFTLIVLYSNLHNQASEGIPLLTNYSIKIENSIDSGKLYQRIIFNKETQKYSLYLDYMNRYKEIADKRIDLTHEYFGFEYKEPENNKPVDSELNYYLNTVDAQDVKEVVDFIRKENFKEVAIKINDQRFVRFNQFDVFFERKADYDYNIYDDHDLITYRWYDYIITDESLNLPTHQEVFANRIFKVYKKVGSR